MLHIAPRGNTMSEFPEPKHAFAVNLPGPVLYSGFQVFGIFLLTFSPALALMVCGLRVYSRRLSTGLGLDDWLIFLAAVLGVPQAVFATLFLRAGGWGIHEVDLPPNIPWNQGAFWAYLNRIFYTPLLVLVKISALLFLLRLGGTKRSVRLACHVLIWFLLAQGLAFLPSTIFMCEPISFAWLGTREGSCIRGDYHTVALAATNILTDILTLMVPFVAFLSIKLSNRVRFALLAVFALGGLVTFTSILRLYYVLRIWWIEPEDRHYSLGYTLNTVEVNLAIVTATIPALWPLGRLWFPAMFESMGINRPYLYPDIEVGYVLSQTRSSQQAASSAGAGSTTTKASRPALRGKTLWLQRPRQPSFLRSPTCPTSGGGGAGIGGIGLTDIRDQRVLGATTGRGRNRAGVGSGDDDEDGFFEDYHEMIRRTEVSLVHDEEDGASTLHNKPLESEGGTRSSSEIRGG